MGKSKILSTLLSVPLLVPLLDVQVVEITPRPEQHSVEIEETLNLKDYKLTQMETLAEIQYKRQQDEKRKMEEIKRQLEEEVRSKKPHFNPYNVSELSNLNKEQIHKMLDGTSLITLVDALYWYEQEYKVNLIFIISIVALESGWGKSELAITHNNLTGYIGQSGDFYSFSSWGESLEETFRLISEEYIKEDGLFYNGSSVWNINQRYCELDSWSGKVISIGNSLLAKIN